MLLTKSPRAAVPALIAVWMLAAPTLATPVATLELCTAGGIIRIADPNAPQTPAPAPDCAKACHFGASRRRC